MSKELGTFKKPHPEKCPKCGSEIVYFERFVNGGSYCCDDCDWEEKAFIDPRIERKVQKEGKDE